jgi:hypothetical protein
MTPRFRIQGGLGLMLLAYALAIHAQEQPVDEADGTAGETTVETGGETAGETAGPALLELLEFIGEFTTEDGAWVDPAVLLEVEDTELAGGTRRDPPVFSATGGVAGEVQPAAPEENCIAARCE